MLDDLSTSSLTSLAFFGVLLFLTLGMLSR